MGAIVIRTRFDEGTESAEVATSAIFSITIVFTLKNHCIIGCIKALKRLKKNVL